MTLLRKKNAKGISKLMKISDKIATLNVERYRTWKEQVERPAILYYDGAAHRGFDAWSFSDETIKMSAQNRVRILSGLYGLLRPYDRIKAHRLEMGTKLQVDDATKTLYAFWHNKITDLLLHDIDLSGKRGDPIVVNCCSVEYAKAVRTKRLEEKGVTFVTCSFPGPSVYAKRARGMMCRFIAENGVENVKELESFCGYEDDAHYVFDKAGSSKKKNTLVFNRRAGPPPPASKRRKRH